MDDPQSIANLKDRMAAEQVREGPPPGFPALPPLAPGRYTSQDFMIWKRSIRGGKPGFMVPMGHNCQSRAIMCCWISPTRRYS